MPIVVTAIFTAREGKERELRDALAASIPAVHEEPGCLLFALHVTEGGSPVLIEKWESVELLEAHLAGEPVAALIQNIQPHLEGDAQVVRIDPVPAGRSDRGVL